MIWRQVVSTTVVLARVLAVSALVAASFLFVGWSIMASRTSGIALVTLTAVVVLVLSSLGHWNDSTTSPDKGPTAL